jgi:hypothetical protein
MIDPEDALARAGVQAGLRAAERALERTAVAAREVVLANLRARTSMRLSDPRTPIGRFDIIDGILQTPLNLLEERLECALSAVREWRLRAHDLNVSLARKTLDKEKV